MGEMSRRGEKARTAIVRIEDAVSLAEQQFGRGDGAGVLSFLQEIRSRAVEARLELCDMLRGIRQGYVLDEEEEEDDQKGEAASPWM